MNKKGDATDIIFFGIIIFFLAISFVVVILVNTKIADVIQNTALNQSTASADILTGINNINMTVVQRGYVLMFALFIVGMLISAFLVRVNPVFIFVYMFTLVLSILISIYTSNLYQAVVESGQISAISANYPMISFIMQNSVKILIAVGALSMIVTFSKLAQPSISSGGDL